MRADGARRLSNFPRVPTTIILTGDDDQVIPADSSEVLHERIPDSLLYVVRGRRPPLFLEQPEEILRALETFVPA